MTEELITAFEQAGGDDSVRAVVLTGAGGEFSSGADLSAAGGDGPALAGMRRLSALALSLHSLVKPTIAKVDGVAAGMGVNLALGCDLIVASERARFSEIFARRGLSVDCGGSWLLPRLVGLHRAKELVFFGDVVSAGDAAAMGLVNRVVPADELDGVVDEWAGRLAAGPPVALSMSKALLNQSFEMSLAQALEREATCQTVNFSTADVAEAFMAFAQKRDAVFTGR
jgi:2-(1,2-epoxy-1,2-dihydrophenyl)acetyl-CoA isomerase